MGEPLAGWAVVCGDGERHTVPFGRQEVADEFAAAIDTDTLPYRHRDCRPHHVSAVVKIDGKWIDP